VTDMIDRASEREELFRRAALVAHKDRYAVTGTMVEGAPGYCRLCEEMIPRSRLRALPGVTTCVRCQEILESAQKRGLIK